MAKVFALCTLIFSLFLAIPAKAEAPKNLRIGMAQFPSTLHPLFDEMTAKTYVLGMAVRPVTVHDTSWKPICLLCTELPTFENGRAKKIKLKDGKNGIAATYTIQPKATWGDGVPVTTKDILFTWQVGKHPLSGVSNGDFYAKDIANIIDVDDKTFTIEFSKEQCEFAAINDLYALPEHLERAVFEKDPATYKSRTLYNTNPTNPGLFWGPYKITKVDMGSFITLTKNETWFGTQPYFETIKVKAIENSSSLSANLLSKDIDYIAGELGLTLDQAIALEKRLPAGAFDTLYKPGLIYEHIDFNLNQAPFNDLRVRQALLYGTNRDNINKRLFDNKQPIAATNVNPLDTSYSKDTKQYGYDPVIAAKLLDDAGWKVGKDGMRSNDKGEPLRVYLSTTAGNKTRELVEQSLQSDWKKIGIDVKIENQVPRVLFGTTLTRRQMKGGVMFAWTSAPRAVPKTTMHSSMIPTAANNYAGQNYAGYNNPKVDKLLEDLETVCAPKQNQDLWNTLQKTYADELPALPLFFRAEAYFVPKWLTGIVPTGHMHPSTLWIENWAAK